MSNHEEGFDLKDWAFAQIVSYDKTELYKEQVEALTSQLSDLCKKLEIPMVMCLGLSNSNDGDGVQVIQALPNRPGAIGFSIMKAVVVANKVDVELENIDTLASLRGMRSACTH